MNVYEEPVGRYRIARHEELPESHKEAKRAHGIDPDTDLQLIWSFNDFGAAVNQFQRCCESAASWETYHLIDKKVPSTITRVF